MCNSKAAQTIVTDPLANYKQNAASSANYAYQKNLPALMGQAGNLGNYSTAQAGYPDILNQANTAESTLLKTASGGPDSGPFANLKKNLLGTYDTGIQKYTLDPLKEQLINEGIYSSGPGMDAYQNAGNIAAQNRALLGSEQDVNALNLERNVISDASGLGSQMSQILQLLGFQNPMQAITQSQNQPKFQDINTEQYTPTSGLTDIMKLLGQGLVSPVISSIPGGGVTAQSPIQGAMKSILGLLGIQSPQTYNTGTNLG